MEHRVQYYAKHETTKNIYGYASVSKYTDTTESAKGKPCERNTMTFFCCLLVIVFLLFNAHHLIEFGICMCFKLPVMTLYASVRHLLQVLVGQEAGVSEDPIVGWMEQELRPWHLKKGRQFFL